MCGDITQRSVGGKICGKQENICQVNGVNEEIWEIESAE
jgi:hypothetical protein